MLPRQKLAGNYHVVPFMPDDVRGRTNAFYDVGSRASLDARERIRQKLIGNRAEIDSLIKSIPYAEVYCWHPISEEMKARLKEMLGEELDSPPEYAQYGRVYFLNEVALNMYREAGELFDVLKIIPGEEVPHINGPTLRGPYLPKEE
jgi:hypothetical protein